MLDRLKMNRARLAAGYAKDDYCLGIRPAIRGVVGWERRSHTFLH